MFVRGGVYVVVRDSMGPLHGASSRSRRWSSITSSPARSASVSAGQYLGRLLNEIAEICITSSCTINPNYVCGCLRRRRDHLLLVEQHQGHSRIERQGAAHHADHHRDGGDPADLVPDHAAAARQQSSCRPLPTPSNLHFSNESLGWLRGHLLAEISRSPDDHRVRPLAAGDERLRDAGAGLPRDRLSRS